MTIFRITEESSAFRTLSFFTVFLLRLARISADTPIRRDPYSLSSAGRRRYINRGPADFDWDQRRSIILGGSKEYQR